MTDLPGEPLVSVVMPVYNAERYLADALRSILGQTYPHFELIVADDGSGDGSPDIIRSFAASDPRVRPLFLPHGGPARSQNAAVALAQGAFIAQMDNDDIALPQRLAAQVTWMQRTGVDVCGSCAVNFEGADNLDWYPETHQAICHDMVLRSGFIHPTVMARAAVLKAHPYREGVVTEDYELWTRLAPLYRFGNVPQVLLKRRCHPQQMTARLLAHRADWDRLRRHYFLTLFPDAADEDFAVVGPLPYRDRISRLADLERAGRWLVRLADTPEPYFRRRMAEYWRRTCRRSAHLGPGCFRTYRRIASQFGLAVPSGSLTLWLACILRAGQNSPLYPVLARFSS